MKRRIWPDSAAPLILSIAFIQSASVALSGSVPSHFITSGTVSLTSLRKSTLPLYFESNRSQIDLISGASSLLTMIPVIPLCQGTV